MTGIEGYEHSVASHCETGSLRNLARFHGLDLSEPMVFGLGSGALFTYVFFVKGPGNTPLVALRNTPGKVFKGVTRACGVPMEYRAYSTTDQAMAAADAQLQRGRPVALLCDMYYMDYLPKHMHVHAPFHFVVLVGREGGDFLVSDPYHTEIARLSEANLRAAWETHAPMATDNLVVHLQNAPADVDLRALIGPALRRTCRQMILPPLIRNMVWFVGIQGMRTYARSLRRWPDKYRGVFLREGLLFCAVTFEEQGTGGGAFRIMYSAFLQEAAELCQSDALRELSDRMYEHGQAWRNTSRTFVRLGKRVPMKDEAYDDWHAEHGSELREGMNELAEEFERKADFEQQFFGDLLRVAVDLK